MRKKTCGIYKITSPSGKVYIGQSINIEHRFWHYRSMNCKNQTKLYHSLCKYGQDAHLFEILHECNRDELNEMEVFYISKFDTFNSLNGLNLTSGGLVCKASDETKKRNSERMKKYFKDNPLAYQKTVAQLTSIDRNGDKNPKYGTGRFVFQFKKTGEWVAMHKTAIAAAKKNGFDSVGIYACCHRKKHNSTHAGFIWRFWDDCKIIDGKLNEKKPSRKIQKNKTSHYVGVALNKNNYWRACIYDTDFKKKVYLGEYKTEIEAARAVNVYYRDAHGIEHPIYDIENPFDVSIALNKIIKSRGVWKNKYHQFESKIIYKGKYVYIGGFYTHKEAAMAYNKKAIELLGDKAILNVIEE